MLLPLGIKHSRFCYMISVRSDGVTDGLVRAGIALSSAPSLDRILQVMADIARELVNARYAAMGVLNAEGTGLSNFVASGMTEEQKERIGELPRGRGILGLLIREPHPIRISDISQHRDSAGFPPHHPTMHSFLGVPVMARGRVFGNLYVTEKIGAPEFTDDDVALIETLAAQSAIAIENAYLRRERDRFFASASHELGNAVAGVQLWARALVRNPPDDRDELLEGLQNLQKGADHARRLIEDLLSLSKIEEGKLKLTAWRMYLREAAAEAIAQLQPEAEAGGIKIELIAEGEPAMIEADPVRVRQIIFNLLSNAIKFTPPGGTIEVRIVTQDDGSVLAAVRDQGPGIAPEDVDRIFYPYEQVSGVARGRGTGLGLPLSLKLARLMGGELWVESTPGAGSTFKLLLPPIGPASEPA